MSLRPSYPISLPPLAGNRAKKIANLRALIRGVEMQPDGTPGDAVTAARANTYTTGANDNLPAHANTWRTGIRDIDTRLPGYELRGDTLHEISGAGYGDTCAAAGFSLALLRSYLSCLKASSGPSGEAAILWCMTERGLQEFGHIYGHGLYAFGIDPGRIIFVRARRDIDALWALEEGARCSELAAVIGDISNASFTQTRRLALAAAAGRTPVLLLRSHGHASMASAAATRWRIAAARSVSSPFVPAVTANPTGPPRWHVNLQRCRGGSTGAWLLEWCDGAWYRGIEHNEEYRFRLAAASAARPAAAAQERHIYRSIAN